MERTRNNQRLHRAKRVRAKISGTATKPRLNVFRSLKAMNAQLIDDNKGETIVSAKLAEVKGAKNDVDGAGKLGELIAKKAIDKKITEVVFDRAGYIYHGKIKAIAEGARKAGLKF
ncbi:MAG: 50S ribosomal protein L18 [Candidatus Moraniibacteriota bacterium]|jgi:large subunit ribosomal protein L18